jgi:hypothetical protein
MRIFFSAVVSVSAFLSARVIAAPSKFSRKANHVSILVQIPLSFMIAKDQATGFLNGVTLNLAISSTSNYDEERHFLFRRPLYG